LLRDKKKYQIQFQTQEFEASEGDNLRNVLLKNKLSPHNGAAVYLNCKGFGTCGTCAIEIKGNVNSKSSIEKVRLRFPPHKADAGLRLACQIRVNSDLTLLKHEGFWGSHTK
tara:strand:+ start:35745 stop:36080 length:336 start_codon:yes stop_codon:yes gene_type:complete